MCHAMSFLQESGGRLMFCGRGGRRPNGPPGPRRDAVVLLEQSSPAAFMAIASDTGYLAGIGHRTAALEDSRLVPLEDIDRKAPA
jgi:hypothetical protein